MLFLAIFNVTVSLGCVRGNEPCLTILHIAAWTIFSRSWLVLTTLSSTRQVVVYRTESLSFPTWIPVKIMFVFYFIIRLYYLFQLQCLHFFGSSRVDIRHISRISAKKTAHLNNHSQRKHKSENFIPVNVRSW